MNLANRICTMPRCDKPLHARGYCRMHHERFRKHGDPEVSLLKMPGWGEAQAHLRNVVLVYDGDECLVWPFYRNSSGYGQISHTLVHRFVCEQEHGPPPEASYVAAHSCGKGHEGCVSKRHLSWKTQAENMADAVQHGTTTRGERQPTSKLTAEDVLAIRSLAGTSFQREIAKKFNVTRQTVGDIISRKRWAWL